MCGKLLVPPVMTAATGGEVLSAVPGPTGAGRARYALTALLILIFAIVAGTNLFVIMSDMATSPEKAGETTGKTILPLVFWVVMITLAWRGIKSREPKSDAQFRARHRKFRIAAGLTVVVLVGLGLGLGIWNSRRIRIADAIRKVGADNADLQAKGTEFRRQLLQIRSRDTPTMRDYYYQCAEVEKLLNDYEPARQRAVGVIQRMRQIVPPDDKSVAAMLNGSDEVLRLDDQILRDLRQEIAYSKGFDQITSSRAEGILYGKHPASD
jgi:hypothetical protein